MLRGLGLPDDAEHVNPNGGAIALGHPLGMSGARLALSAALELADRGAAPGGRDHVHRRRPGHRRAAGGAVTTPPDDPQVGEDTCPDCAGTGSRDGGECSTCAGTGVVAEVVGDA